jgi:DNA polymerase III subunit delta
VSNHSYRDLQRSLRSPSAGGVFFLFGDEAYLRDRAVEEVIEAYVEPATRDFNLDQVRGGDVTAEALAALLATPPMMATHRVVVVRDAQGLSNKAREAVERALPNPPPGLVLVLAAAIPAGSKAKFYSELQRHAYSVEFAAVSINDAPGWLMERAKELHDLDLEPEAARALVAGIGAELGILAAELEKVAAFVGERRAITLEDVRAVGGSLPQYDRWAWFDLVGDRRFAEALQMLPALLRAGESGVALVSGLATQFLRLGLVCAGGSSALERELKPYQRWLARRIVPQAKRWDVAAVDCALAELVRTDRLLKSASLTDRQAMEELLLRLAHGGATSTRVA